LYEIQIRSANSDDSNQIARLLVALYEAEMPGMLAGPQESRVELLRQLIANNKAVVRCGLVLTQGQEIIGYGATAPADEQREMSNTIDVLRQSQKVLGLRNGAIFTWHYFRFQSLMCVPLPKNTAQMHSLVIDPAQRGKGYGERMLRAMEQQAVDSCHQIALLYVVAGNPAQRLYERMGYLVVPTPSTAGAARRLLRKPGLAMAKRLPVNVAAVPQSAEGLPIS
jgi:ribosomal protein S18 acetylase RimI-like enzyme